MYKELNIHDFRQFKNIDIRLGKVLTVLAGRNSTGKSTILGILANSGELKKKDGLTYSNGQFRAEFSEILKGSKKFDASGSERMQINIIDESGNLIDYRKFRTAWQKDSNSKDRFRIIPSKILDDGKKTEAKLEVPVIYLGLSRLFPIGEANDDSLNAKHIKFDSDDDETWFVSKYSEILSLYDSITNVENYSIGETDKKTGVGIETDKYDYLTNSAGQDNLGQILMAMLSFRRLASTRTPWTGGLLLIDEVDATLHPAAQKRLIDLLIQEGKKYKYQIAVTTHSSDLLKHITVKTEHNSLDINNVELYYFTNANRRMEAKRNPLYSTIENDLLIMSMLQTGHKIKVYSEDAENRWFMKKLINDYLPYVDVLDVQIGCTSLMSLYANDSSYFGNTIIVFDGDVAEEDLKKIPDNLRAKMNNIVTLPGTVRPESVFYDYLMSLDADHPYWESASKFDMNWLYFKENGPESELYKKEKERERYKAWFKNHQQVFDNTKLYDFWARDHEDEVKAFKDSFVNSYNSVANRMFAIKIDNPEC